MSPDAQVRAFIAKFEPKQQRLIEQLRRATRRRLPHANELVYDNYNFLVFAWCPSERVSDSYFSLGANAQGVNLFFGYNGSKIDDPKGLLQGKGKLNRFVRLESAKHFASSDVQALITSAIDASVVRIQDTPGKLVIRGISPKQRPRRAPAKTNRAKRAAPRA